MYTQKRMRKILSNSIIEYEALSEWDLSVASNKSPSEPASWTEWFGGMGVSAFNTVKSIVVEPEPKE